MRRKRYFQTLCFFLLLLGLSLPRLVFAGQTGLEKAKGKVDIRLEEFTLDKKGREVPWQDLEAVMPGQEIVKIPRVTNLQNTCEIRAKIEVSMGKKVEIPVTDDMIKGMPKGWKKHEDGWYYYEEKLKKGEKTDIFRSFTIPPNWNTKYDDKGNIRKYYTENSLDIVVTVEAVGDGDWSKEVQTVHSPKTGDDAPIILTAVLCLGSLAGAFAAWKWRKS